MEGPGSVGGDSGTESGPASLSSELAYEGGEAVENVGSSRDGCGDVIGRGGGLVTGGSKLGSNDEGSDHDNQSMVSTREMGDHSRASERLGTVAVASSSNVADETKGRPPPATSSKCRGRRRVKQGERKDEELRTRTVVGCASRRNGDSELRRRVSDSQSWSQKVRTMIQISWRGGLIV